LGTIQDLGVLIGNTTKTVRDDIGTWSATLFNGDQDSTGNTIMYDPLILITGCEMLTAYTGIIWWWKVYLGA